MPDSCTPGSPVVLRRKQSMHSSSPSSSSPGRMSLSRNRAKQSREDTPDPRAVPSEYCGPTPLDMLSQEVATLQHHPSSVAPTSSRRYRRHASSAAVHNSGSQQRGQPASQAGSSPLSHTATHSSVSQSGVQAPIPEHVHAEMSHCSEPQQEHTGPKWTLKFKPAPHHPIALSAAAADPLLAMPAKLTCHAGSSRQAGSAEPLHPMQAQPDTADLPSRLQHVQLSGALFCHYLCSQLRFRYAEQSLRSPNKIPSVWSCSS